MNPIMCLILGYSQSADWVGVDPFAMDASGSFMEFNFNIAAVIRSI